MFRNEKFVLILLSIVYAFIGFSVDNPTMQTLGMMGWFGLFQLIYCINSWIRRGNQLISPYIVFLTCLYVFSYGQSFLWAFGLESERTLIGFHGITIPDIFNAQVQTIIMLAFFHIGAIYYLEKKQNLINNKEIVIYDYIPSLKKAGWLLFFVSVIPYVSETVNNMFLSISRGYGALYEQDVKIGVDNFWGFIAEYFIPSIICLFIAYKDKKIYRRLFLFFLLLNITAILLTGGRSDAVILLSLLAILYNYLVKKFSRRWIVVGIVGMIVLLQVLGTIANIRGAGFDAARREGFEIENNAAVDAIAEMGGTMFCLIKTNDLVPDRAPYKYGKSYLFAFTTLIPNLGFWDIHPAKKESNLGDWLEKELNLGYGTGFSMCAEAYANFGYLGIFLFFFWGWFLASIFGKIEISVHSNNYALLAFLLILFWFFLKLPRNNFINLVRPVFFIAGPIYLFCKYSKRR